MDKLNAPGVERERSPGQQVLRDHQWFGTQTVAKSPGCACVVSWRASYWFPCVSYSFICLCSVYVCYASVSLAGRCCGRVGSVLLTIDAGDWLPCEVMVSYDAIHGVTVGGLVSRSPPPPPPVSLYRLLCFFPSFCRVCFVFSPCFLFGVSFRLLFRGGGGRGGVLYFHVLA